MINILQKLAPNALVFVQYRLVEQKIKFELLIRSRNLNWLSIFKTLLGFLRQSMSKLIFRWYTRILKHRVNIHPTYSKAGHVCKIFGTYTLGKKENYTLKKTCHSFCFHKEPCTQSFL